MQIIPPNAQQRSAPLVQFDDMKNECESLKKKNPEQAFELKNFKSKFRGYERKIRSRGVQAGQFRPIHRRQNLEFKGIPVTENEDVVDLEVKIRNLVGAKVKRDDILTAHRLPPGPLREGAGRYNDPEAHGL